MGRLLIHATNVHQGGGKALLDAVLGSDITCRERILLADSRMAISSAITEKFQVRLINPSIIERLRAEWWLARNVQSGDFVLCFGNLPPLFKLNGQVTVFMQNKYLLEDVPLSNLPWKVRLRLKAERIWFDWKSVNADQFIVQTPTMKTSLASRLSKRTILFKNAGTGAVPAPIQILPFLNTVEGYQRKLTTLQCKEKKDFDFVYVASGESHKNHANLIEAWCLLAQQGQFPSLALTLDESAFPDLCESIRQKKVEFSLRLENLGVLPHDQIDHLYRRAGALVNPSTFESLGLPLIEARQAGLPVLAPELDYVRDVLDPEQTFDPESPTSIARAIKRFLGIEEPALSLHDATEFMNHILGKAA